MLYAISQAFTILIPTLKSRDILECGIYYITTVSYDIFLKRVSECVNFYDFHFFYYLLISISSFAVYSHAWVLWTYMDVFSLNLLQFIEMKIIWQFHEISNVFNIFREITTRIVLFFENFVK